jgi:hypothetical protein
MLVYTRPIFANVVWPRPRSELLAAGIKDSRLRGPNWVATSRGWYVPAGCDLTRDVQRIAAAVCRLPPHGAIGGWAAARVLGAGLCDGLAADGVSLLDVPLCVGERDVRAVAGVAPWRDPLPAGEVVTVEGVRVTSATRTCSDGMRRAPDVVEAVVFADQMLHAGLVSLPQIRESVASLAGWRGVPQARRALQLADPQARNGWETRLRMVWVGEAGLPRPLCNPPVFDLRGNLLGFPDLLDPEAGLVGEFDGSVHRGLAHHGHDNVREELLEDHNLVVTRAVSLDFADPPALAQRMRRAYQRGLRRDRRLDRWTLLAPPDWGGDGAEDELGALFDAADAAWAARISAPATAGDEVAVHTRSGLQVRRLPPVLG